MELVGKWFKRKGADPKDPWVHDRIYVQGYFPDDNPDVPYFTTSGNMSESYILENFNEIDKFND